MWIMLKVKLPINPSPPKMSIHWGVPWPDLKYHKKIMEQMKYPFNIVMRGNENNEIFHSVFGKEPNWKNAIGIQYKGEKIRIFPHEFCKITKNNFRMYIEENAFELVPTTEAERLFMNRNLSKGQRFIYDAAQIDGCNNYEAMMVAMNRDPTDEPPPIGWYKLREEYANTFCYAEEQKE